MVWTLTVGGVAVQSYLNPLRSLQVQNKGYQGSVATLKCRLIEQSPYVLNLTTEQEVILTDPSAVRAFGGYLREIGRSDKNAAGIREWSLVGQDYSTDLVDDYVPVGVTREVAETDKAFVQWLITTYSTRGLLAPDATVSQVLAGNITPLGDIGGLTLYEVLQRLNDETGAKFWVDYDHRLNYKSTANTTAPFDVDVQAPNPAAVPRPTRPVRDFDFPEDSIDYVNEVLVIGTGISTTVYRGGVAPAPGTRRAVVYRDEEITTLAQAQQRGAAVLGGHTNRNEGTFTTWYGGLRAGQLIHIKNTMYSLDADYPIQQVDFVPLDAEQAMYRVTFGAKPVSIQGLFQQQQELLAETHRTVTEVAATTADTVPPGQVSGLNMVSGYEQAEDGTQWPNVEAYWSALPESDLDAYEVELDRAITGTVAATASASGTGGTLPAGEYTIVVTGLGTVYGETAASDIPITATVAAGQRLYVTITGKTGISAYRVYVERADDPRLGRVAGATTTTITGVAVEVTAEGTTGDPTAPAVGTAAAFTSPGTHRTPNVRLTVDGVQGGIVYVGRVRGVDKSGNKGPFSALTHVQAQRDPNAPELPTGLTAIAGKGLVGLRWQRNTEPDLARYGIRYAPDDGLGAPTADWVRITTTGTVAVVTDLVVGTTYHFQIRAIDTSGQVRTSAVDATAVLADTNPDAGWTASVLSTPGLITGSDIAAGSIVASHVAAAGLDAGVITAGSLAVGGMPGVADQIAVYSSTGDLIATIDENGVEFRDPSNTNRRVRFLNGQQQFSSDAGATWTTAISADGITADAIKLGSAPGGHNSVPNASFELSAFASTLSKVWTSSADWTASITASDVNVNKGTTELRMTTVTY